LVRLPADLIVTKSDGTGQTNVTTKPAGDDVPDWGQPSSLPGIFLTSCSGQDDMRAAQDDIRRHGTTRGTGIRA